VGLGIAVIILIFSGLLNSVIVPGNNINATTGTKQNSGVDLSSLQKINDLEAVVKNNPQDTASILELAHLKNDAGMYEQAILNYKEYLVLAPKDADARIDMGICYYNLQNYDTAISEMEQALKYNSKHQIGYLDLGIVNLAAGKIEKSKEWLKKAIELDPNSDYGKKAQELLSSHNNKSNGGK
jgi:tetratricopeptide (TPR) repeat protein